MAISLLAQDGPLAGQRFELNDGEHLAGAGADGLDLGADDRAGERHALLVVADGGLAVRDWGSATGTFLNGHRVTEAPLHDGDILQLGRSRFRVEISGAAGPACPNCGLALGDQPPDLCPRCGRDLEAVRSGVVAAQAPAARYCSACGQSLPASARFCPACGQDCQAAAPPTPTGTPRWLWPAAIGLVFLALMVLLLGGLSVSLLAVRDLARSAGVIDGPVPAPPMPAGTEAPAPPMEAPAGQPAAQPAWLREGKVRLRYGGQPGERRRYKASSQVQGTMSVMGQTVPLNVNAGSGFTQEILDNQGGRLRMRLAMDPFNVQQNGMPFAGALPAAPAPVTVTMDPSGKVLSAEQPGGGETPAVAGLPGGVTPDFKAVVQQLAAAAFPDRELAVGDTWAHDVTVPLPNGGNVTYHAQCRLDGFETVDGTPTARVVTQLDAPLSMNLADPQTGEPVGNVGKLAGTVTSYFDPARGALVRSVSDLDMTMTMALAKGAGTMPKELEGVPGLSQVPGAGDVSVQANGKVRQTVTLER